MIKSRFALLLLLVWSLIGLFGTEVRAQTEVGVLIVGDGTKAQISQAETAVKEELRDLLSRQGLADTVPLLTYHFDRPAERKYCESKLGIKAADLPAVAVVERSGTSPRKVLHIQRHITSPEDAAELAVRQAILKITGVDEEHEEASVYAALLKEPKKLGFHPNDDDLTEIYATVRARYVDPINKNHIMDGIVKEVRKLLKAAKVSDKALATVRRDDNIAQNIADTYKGKINQDVLWFAMIRGMLGGLKDPYSVLMLPSEYKTMMEQMQVESFGGIGIYIELDRNNNNQLTVVEPIEDTPAWKAGLHAGDMIVRINGKATKGLAIDLAVERIRGPVGSQVTLTIKRKGMKGTEDITVTRASIKVTSVTSKMIDKDLGYVRLRLFGSDTATEVKNALDRLKAQGAKGYILDVRNNGGGYINAAVDICSLFMPEGDVVVSTVGRTNSKQPYKSVGPGEYKMPMVLLVNQFSASASEITAGALKDNRLATLVGVKTFGKGSVQQIFNLRSGAVLKLTVAHFFSPKGQKIDHKGIVPDVLVKMEPREVGRDKDTQLKKAVDVLRKQIAASSGKPVFLALWSWLDQKPVFGSR